MTIKNRIKSLLKNKAATTLIENFLSLSLLQVAGYIFPLITLPYLARVIGIDKFGEIAFASAVIIYFETLVNFGFNYTAIRDIAKNRDNIVFMSKVFSTVMAARIILMLISLMVLEICILTIPFFYDNRLILWLTFLYIPGNIMFPEWFFQAVEQMKYITIINVISKLLFTVLVFFVIKEKSDYIYQPLLVSLGFFVSGIIAIIIIRKKFHIQFSYPSIEDIFLAIKGSANMFIVLFLPNLYTNFSTILLRSYGGEIITGIYSSGYRFISLVDSLSLVLSRTFYPFLARRIDKHSLFVKIGFSLSVLASLFLFFGADLLVNIFYTKEFTDSATVIKIMAISPFFLFLMNTYGANYLVLVGAESIFRNIVIFCSLGGFILSWIIVPKYGFMGAAITITIVWGIRGFLTWLYVRRYNNRMTNNI